MRYESACCRGRDRGMEASTPMIRIPQDTTLGTAARRMQDENGGGRARRRSRRPAGRRADRAPVARGDGRRPAPRHRRRRLVDGAGADRRATGRAACPTSGRRRGSGWPPAAPLAPEAAQIANFSLPASLRGRSGCRYVSRAPSTGRRRLRHGCWKLRLKVRVSQDDLSNRLGASFWSRPCTGGVVRAEAYRALA